MSKRVGILRDAIEKVAPRLTPAIAADPTRRRTIRVRYPFIIGVTVADTVGYSSRTELRLIRVRYSL